eukprot:TRINITY_DN28921_c0_g1_i1.p1 TRINITY_DN28921_c0_g1~~TRINITY_DN28921_c0_g1_i1.p1  ORF type:complete len:559 (+),score=82.98 TRINITY_DN28921_c0_g1_i1:87-1763(+)
MSVDVDSDVEVLECVDNKVNATIGTVVGLVPCEVCGLRVPFGEYVEHISTHDASNVSFAGSSSDKHCCTIVDEDDGAPDVARTPTPQKKRARLHESSAQELESLTVADSDVEISGGSTAEQSASSSSSSLSSGQALSGFVPCEVCRLMIPFASYAEHVSTHAGEAKPDMHGSVGRERIPCDICAELVAVEDFAEHAKTHKGFVGSGSSASSSAVPCEICSVMIEPAELADHMAAHRVHEDIVNNEMKQSSSEVDVTVQVVEMARKGGSGLPGNRRSFVVGDAVLVRWSDGHWYKAHLESENADGQMHVSWDPPFQSWDAETVSPDAVIARTDQAREVCNFDVALAFVRKLKSCKDSSSTRENVRPLEIVYHYTREENVDKIVDNNLKVPGSKNADGTKVDVKNGSVYGRGIYAATDMHYGQNFGAGLKCAFMCLAIPGRVAEARNKLTASYDSFQQGQLRVYGKSEQLLPLFFTDTQHSSTLETRALEIAVLLETKILGIKRETFEKGSVVEVYWEQSWWRASVRKLNPNGSVVVDWLPPWDKYPKYCAAPHDVRKTS